MIVLDSDRSLIAVLEGAVATNPDFSVAYGNIASGVTFTESLNNGVLNGLAEVTLVAAPAVGSIRLVKTIQIYNAHTAEAIVLVKVAVGASRYVLHRRALQSKQTLVYEDGMGWWVDSAGSGTFSDVIVTSLTASRLVASDASKKVVSVPALSAWIAGTINQISVADDGDGSVTLSAPQDLHSGASPTFAGLTLTAFSGFVKATAGVLSAAALTDADIPDTITLTNITQITNRSHVNLSDIGTLSHATIDSYLDQTVKIASSPAFITVKLSNLTDGYLPYHVSDAAGLANSPIYTDGTNIGIGTASIDAGVSLEVAGPIYMSGTGAFVIGSVAAYQRMYALSNYFTILGADNNYAGLRMSKLACGDSYGANTPPASGAIIEGSVFIGDTSNAFMTKGLTINQGAADDEILALKSSDVDHGITSWSETDTFFNIKKFSPTDGGVWLHGFSETTCGAALVGIHTTDVTAKSTGTHGAVDIIAQLKSGTTNAACGADANLLVVINNSLARFIFDAEGSAHADVEWVAFQDHDDISLLESLELEFDRRKFKKPKPLKLNFDKEKQDLGTLKVVSFYDEDGPRAMINLSRLPMLQIGAIRQLNEKVLALQNQVAILGTRLK